MDERARSWEAAITEYARLAAEGDPSAPELLAVARWLADGPAGRVLTAQAYEGHLELFGPGGRASYLRVVSETDEIEHCLMIGEDPDDLGLEPGYFLVEWRGLVREAGNETDAALEEWRGRSVEEACGVVVRELAWSLVPNTP